MVIQVDSNDAELPFSAGTVALWQQSKLERHHLENHKTAGKIPCKLLQITLKIIKAFYF